MKTLLTYLYRDAGNFKAWRDVVLNGHISEEDRLAIFANLSGGEYFIAEQVGLPPLYSDLYRWSGDRATAEDHCWHELYSIKVVPETEVPETAVSTGEINELIDKFLSIDLWDDSLSPHYWLGSGVSESWITEIRKLLSAREIPDHA